MSFLPPSPFPPFPLSLPQLQTFAIILLGDTAAASRTATDAPIHLPSLPPSLPQLQTFAIILLGNTAAASLTATGAFEVTFFGPPEGGREGGGEGGMVAHVVFSKLATGRMPNGHEILRRLRELGLME